MPRNFAVMPAASIGAWIEPVGLRMSTRSPHAVVLDRNPAGEILRIQLVELRIGHQFDRGSEAGDCRVGHFRVGELRRQHLAVDQRDGDRVTQAHLRVQRRTRRIVETALHIDHLAGADADFFLCLPRRAEFLA